MAAREPEQLALWDNLAPLAENPDYLSRQLVTYIGNKRSLLNHIYSAIQIIMKRVGKNRLDIFDVFSGSGVVSRFLKAHSQRLVSNDLEAYSAVLNRCFLCNRSKIDYNALVGHVFETNKLVETEAFEMGFIEDMYAPRDEDCIKIEDRVFYTKINARRLDNYRRLIERVPHTYHDLMLGPLLSEASIHANTAGVFKGFYKNRKTKIGQYGGSGSDALSRIMGKIKLEVPILSNFECEVEVFQEDANSLARRLSNFDVAYLDPPYNQHPYGSNYFMLNLLVDYRRPDAVSRVSGIPVNWRRSGYNTRSESLTLMTDLVARIDAKFLLVSYNNEGFIKPEEMLQMLARVGNVEVVETKYNAFRGSRNLQGRSIHTTEHFFIVERR